MDVQLALSAADRVRQLLQHLSIERAHFAQGIVEAEAYPEVVASIALVMPPGVARRVRVLAERGSLAVPPLVVHGDSGPLSAWAPSVLAAYPGSTAVQLRGYHTALWSDVVADRVADVGPALLTYFAEADRCEPIAPVQLPDQVEGEVAGISYRARGSGPPLVLFPLALTASQWEPIISALAAHFCTLTLGGPHLGLLALMEQRARGGYGALIDSMIDVIAPQAGGSILEVGCASGMLSRRIALRTGSATSVVGVDLSSYMLREAAALARREGVAERVSFRAGDAEALPFANAHFDAALAGTLLEEVDAGRALAEISRVVRPGGRIGAVVRAIDLPFWDSLPLRPELRAKLTARSGAGVGPHGCADASLYRRFCALGLTDVVMGPRVAVDRPDPRIRDWRANSEGGMLGSLDPSEYGELRAVIAQAEGEGSYLWGETYHCAIGTKP